MTKRRRRFQYTIRLLLLVTFLSASALTIFRPRVVQVHATIVGVRLVPDLDNGGRVPFVVVRIQNVGRDRVWISGMGFVAFMRFHETTTSAGTYQTRPLELSCLDPGSNADLTIPVPTGSTTRQICVGQKIAERSFAEPEIYWSGKLELEANVPSTAVMQRDGPAGVDIGEFWRKLERNEVKRNG